MQNPYRKLSTINPQQENGHRRINNEIWRALTRYPLNGAEFRLVLAIIDKTWGYGKKSAPISNNQLIESTNLAKTAAIRGIASLCSKKVIVKSQGHWGQTSQYMFNKHYDTWHEATNYLLSLIPQQPSLIDMQSSTQIGTTKEEGSTQIGTTGSTQIGTRVVLKSVLEVVHKPSLQPSLYNNILKQYIKTNNINDESLEKIPQKEIFNFLRKKLFEALKENFGYSSPMPGADAKAMTWLFNQDYSIDNVLTAYKYMKNQPFWKDKGLTLQSVKKDIASIVSIGGGNGAHQGDPTKSKPEFNPETDPLN